MLQYVDEFTFTSVTAEGKPVMGPINHLAVWKALEEFVEEGIIKAIGVSNFNSQQVDRIVQNGKVMFH